MIHLTITVSNTAELLDANAYDAGALLRWESCATVDGIYVEGDTVALVSGTSLYDVWDAAGTAGTFYRTRISDAAATTFSPYSEPFQAAGVLWELSTDQFRLLVTTALGDEALQMLLNAAAQSIVAHVGPYGERSELHDVGGDLILLSRPPLSVASVVERLGYSDLTLDPDDYIIEGRTLRRLNDGTNSAWYWRSRVIVTYTPLDDMAERQRVQMELVKLSLASAASGGGVLSSQTIGTWSESYATTSGVTYQQQRAEILASLSTGVGLA